MSFLEVNRQCFSLSSIHAYFTQIVMDIALLSQWDKRSWLITKVSCSSPRVSLRSMDSHYLLTHVIVFAGWHELCLSGGISQFEVSCFWKLRTEVGVILERRQGLSAGLLSQKFGSESGFLRAYNSGHVLINVEWKVVNPTQLNSHFALLHTKLGILLIGLTYSFLDEFLSIRFVWHFYKMNEN